MSAQVYAEVDPIYTISVPEVKFIGRREADVVYSGFGYAPVVKPLCHVCVMRAQAPEKPFCVVIIDYLRAVCKPPPSIQSILDNFVFFRRVSFYEK